MIVEMTKEAERIITISEMPYVEQMKESLLAESGDDYTDLFEYAMMAARLVSGVNTVKVLDATASFCKNCHVYDRYCEGSGQLDVWVEFTAIATNGLDGIYIVGANLTDIWDITGQPEYDGELRKRMYIRQFREV